MATLDSSGFWKKYASGIYLYDIEKGLTLRAMKFPEGSSFGLTSGRITNASVSFKPGSEDESYLDFNSDDFDMAREEIGSQVLAYSQYIHEEGLPPELLGSLEGLFDVLTEDQRETSS